MKRLLAPLVAATILLGAAVHVLAAENGVVTCALTKAYACTSDEGCAAASLKDMNLPRFIRIDLGNKVISSLDKSVQRGDTMFAAVEKTEGMTVIHGVEKMGWSLAIGEQSGELTISASGDGENFAVFGSCITP